MLCILYRLTDSESPQPKIGRYKVDTYIMLLIKIKRSKNEDEIVHKIPAVFSQETVFFCCRYVYKKKLVLTIFVIMVIIMMSSFYFASIL